MVGFISLDELLKFSHPRLERKQKGQLFQELLDPESSLAKKEVLELSTEVIVDKHFRLEFISSQHLLV